MYTQSKTTENISYETYSWCIIRKLFYQNILFESYIGYFSDKIRSGDIIF